MKSPTNYLLDKEFHNIFWHTHLTQPKPYGNEGNNFIQKLNHTSEVNMDNLFYHDSSL